MYTSSTLSFRHSHIPRRLVVTCIEGRSSFRSSAKPNVHTLTNLLFTSVSHTVTVDAAKTMASPSSTWHACSPTHRHQHPRPVTSTLATTASPATETVRRLGREQRPCRAETNTIHVETLGVDARPNTHHGCQRYQSEPRSIPGQKMCLTTFIQPPDLRIGYTSRLRQFCISSGGKVCFLHMLHITIRFIIFLCTILCGVQGFLFLRRRNTV
jgi:hypothetical protein